MTFLQTATPVEVVPGLFSPDYVFKYYILDHSKRVVYEIPDGTKGIFITYKTGYRVFVGWVNWQIP
jgi:hypothetical protein